MVLLNLLIKLRDDIKTWVTNNLIILKDEVNLVMGKLTDHEVDQSIHVKLSDTTPKPSSSNGSVGTSNTSARADHVHPVQTSVTGNAGSANKVNNAIKIQLNNGATEGTDQFTFDGSTNKIINVTPESIGIEMATIDDIDAIIAALDNKE